MSQTDLFIAENGTSASPYRARYTATFNGSQAELSETIQSLLADLDATYVDPDEEIRLNPLTSQYEVQALVNQEFEFDFIAYWATTESSPILITFDITTPISIERESFNELIKNSILEYFEDFEIIYNFLPRPKVTSQKLLPNPGILLNQNWIKQYRNDYKGRWVALHQGKLLADASSLDDLVSQLETTKDVLLTVVY